MAIAPLDAARLLAARAVPPLTTNPSRAPLPQQACFRWSAGQELSVMEARLGILALACAAALPLTVAADSSAPKLTWSKLPPLPDAHGFGWPFAGVLDDQLLVAGGANFPDRPLWEGGAKKWHDDIFLLAKPDGEWKHAGKLPRPLGYGVSITTPEGVICIGGSDADRHYREVFRLVRDGGEIKAQSLAPLPHPLANGAGALLGQTIYVAGGIETPTATDALKNFWALDLSSPNSTWRELKPWPGPARMLGVVAVVGDAFYLVSGTELSGDAAVKPLRRYLTDAYQFKPGAGWKRLADLPRPAVAAPSPAPAVDGSQFLVISGDDGTKVDFKPLQDHPGFPRDILGYDVRQNSWSTLGEIPGPAPVTVPVVHWRDQFVLPNGEIRPAVRTPDVWSLRVK